MICAPERPAIEASQPRWLGATRGVAGDAVDVVLDVAVDMGTWRTRKAPSDLSEGAWHRSPRSPLPMVSGGAAVRVLHRDLQALLPNANYAYYNNRRNEVRYDDGNKTKNKSGRRE